MRRPLFAAATMAAALACGAATAHADGLLSGPAARAAAQRPAPVPAAAGAYPVGRVDTAIGDRVMVSVWYPAREHGAPAAYVPASGPAAQLEIAGAAAQWLNTPAVTGVVVGARANATEDAAAADGRFPVVVVSPGMGTPRWLLSALAAELASRGWVAVVVDHTGESPAVQFPDGRIVLGTPPTGAPEYMRDQLAARVADVRTVLDALPALPIAGPRLDLSRIAVLGHSYGGTTAVHVLATDARVSAAVAVDGPAGWPGVADAPDTDRPVLLLDLTGQWSTSWEGFDDKRFERATMTRAGHYSAADLCGYGVAGPQLCGTVAPDRAAVVAHDLVVSWLDHTVRGVGGPRYSAGELTWAVR